MASFLRSGRGRVTLVGMVVGAMLLAASALWYRSGHVARQAAPERLHCALPEQKTGQVHLVHPGMVWVAGGSFELGDVVYPEEQPLRRTTVTGFWMDRTEVTNQQFAAFVRATGYITVAERAIDPALQSRLPPEMRQPGAVVFVMPNEISGRSSLTQWWRYLPGAQWRHPGGPGTGIGDRDSFPVVAVTFEDASAYARWKGRELPTEAEWEWAARAGQHQAGRDHGQPKQANTWQGLFPVVNSSEDGFKGLAPAGCYPPNALGLFDMIGNVWELTADAYRPSHLEPLAALSDPTPAAPSTGSAGQRVIKGGSFLCAPNYCMRYRSGSRQPQDDDLGASHLGFRTVLRAPGPLALPPAPPLMPATTAMVSR